MCPTIPSNGRLGKLTKSIAEETSKEILYKLFKDYSTSLKGEKQAVWILNMLKNLEQEIGIESTIKILEQCGRQSCGNGFKNTHIIKLDKLRPSSYST